MGIVQFFRDEKSFRDWPSVWTTAVTAMAVLSFMLFAWWSQVFGSWLVFGIVLSSCVLIICAAATLLYVHFYYLARGSRIYRQACQALKTMERAVEDGCATPNDASEFFAAAREAAAEARTNQSPFRSAAFQAGSRTRTERRYEQIIERELRRLVMQMPLLERPYLAAGPGGHFDAQGFRVRLLQDANVLHCTRTQLINLLSNLVIRGDERNEEYRKKALLRLIESVIWEARMRKFFDGHGTWTGQCEEGMCQELSTATAAILETPSLSALPYENIGCLVAYASSMEDEGTTHTHWRMLPSGAAAKLRMFAVEL